MNNPMMPGAVGYPAQQPQQQQQQTPGFAPPALASASGQIALPAHIAARAAETGGPRKIATAYDGLQYITLRNGQFLLDMGSNQVVALPNPLVAVVLAWQPEPGRVYYDQQYTPGAKNVLPACWSANGREPSAKAPKKQSTLCDVCPQNAKGSAQNGRSKACSYSQRLVLAVPGFEKPLALKLGGMSLFGKNSDPSRNQYYLNEYGKQLASMNADISWVWTAFTFQPQATVPALFMGFFADQSGQPWLSPEALAWASNLADTEQERIKEVVAGEFFVASNNDNPEGEAQYPQAPIQQGHPAATYAGGVNGAPVTAMGNPQPQVAPAAQSMQSVVQHMQQEHAQQPQPPMVNAQEGYPGGAPQGQPQGQQPFTPPPVSQLAAEGAQQAPAQPQVFQPQTTVPQPPQGFVPPQVGMQVPPQPPAQQPQMQQAPAQQQAPEMFVPQMQQAPAQQQAPQAPAQQPQPQGTGVPDFAAIMAAMGNPQG